MRLPAKRQPRLGIDAWGILVPTLQPYNGADAGEDGLDIMHTFAFVAMVGTMVSRLFEPVPIDEQVRNAPLIIFSVLTLSLAAAYLALWRAATDFPIFRNMGVYLLLVGVQLVTTYLGGVSFQWELIALTTPLIVMIAGEAMRVPHRRWTLLIWPLCLLTFFFDWFPSLKFLRPLPVDIGQVFLCILTFQGFRYGKKRDRQIAAAFVFLICVRWTLSPYFRSITHAPRTVTLGGWNWHLNPVSLIVLATTTLVIYVRALIEDRREKQRLADELEAARSVQQVLIPEEIPSIAGFAIQSIYLPAGEVGGDFFQILPLKDDGVLVVIGDVSGKGMPAAMTVSLLVGTVRTLAHYTQRPGEILAAMNQRMLQRSGGGFTTCLVLRVDADGTLTVANAGHIAPYLAGKEVAVDNGLPLGLSAETTYAESVFAMADGQQLTLMTDGVVEARDKSGVLFGFDRTAAHSMDPAEAIAEAAQRFGQEDDISVISLTRTSTRRSLLGRAAEVPRRDPVEAH